MAAYLWDIDEEFREKDILLYPLHGSRFLWGLRFISPHQRSLNHYLSKHLGKTSIVRRTLLSELVDLLHAKLRPPLDESVEYNADLIAGITLNVSSEQDVQDLSLLHNNVFAGRWTFVKAFLTE